CLGYTQLAEINPRLVYCSVTAFGSSGPYVDRPGFDPLLQAMSGMMALQGYGGPPQYLRIAVTDYYTASLAAQAMLTGLFVRERTVAGARGAIPRQAAQPLAGAARRARHPRRTRTAAHRIHGDRSRRTPSRSRARVRPSRARHASYGRSTDRLLGHAGARPGT